MKHTGALALASALVLVRAQRTNILITNDDGWAVANVRAQNDALKAAGYDVSCLRCCPSRSQHCGLLPFRHEQIILSCPAVDKSGTGSSTATPVVLTTPCEYDTCPTGSPAVGFNASDRMSCIQFLLKSDLIRTLICSTAELCQRIPR